MTTDMDEENSQQIYLFLTKMAVMLKLHVCYSDH